MDKLEENLKQINFTQYEAKALIAMIRYNNLDASDLAKYSKVPQSKIYETMEKLHFRGFTIETSKEKKKYYRIRPKQVIIQKLNQYLKEYKRRYNDIKNEIDDIYSTEKISEIPFIGISGQDNIEEHLMELFEQTQKHITCFMPYHYFSDSLINVINTTSDKVKIKIIFKDYETSKKIQSKITKTKLYYLKVPIFDLINNFFEKISSSFIESNNTYALNLISLIIENLDRNFGVALSDQKKSIFIIPIPIKIPMAIMSNLPDLIEFHSKGITEILKSSIQL